MTDNKSSSVVGFAVYFELRRGTQTWQILVTPESPAQNVPASMFRRRLAPSQPRKMWKQVASGVTSKTINITAAVPNAPDAMTFVRSMFDSLVANQWVLLKQPIVVECTDEDAKNVQIGKVPYRVIGRVLKTRKVLRFPDKLFGEVSA